jgi:hypothetical protein
MVAGIPIATRHSLFSISYAQTIMLGLNIALFDVVSDWVVYVGLWYSEKVNEKEGKPKWFFFLYPGLACYVW